MAMGHFRQPFIAILSVAALASSAFAAPLGREAAAIETELELRADPGVRRKQRKSLASVPARYRRGKRAQAKPKRRANRLHISRRVRRKHRRAA
jgi:hypothetical protein